MGAPYNSVTDVNAQLYVSPYVYPTGWLMPGESESVSHPNLNPATDFYVANGSSFRPTEWMLERTGSIYVATCYWVLRITHTNFFDLIYRDQINPPLDVPPAPGTADVYRTAHSRPETRWWVAGRIARNCPPLLSPQNGYDSHSHPLHIRNNYQFAANFSFQWLFNSVRTNPIACAVNFIGPTDCSGYEENPTGGPLAQPTLSTRPDKVTVGLNTRFHDVVYLAGGDRPTGTITFRLYRNDSLIVHESQVGVSGNGQYPSPEVDSSTFGPGQYRYTAHYSGDIRNKSASTSINDPNEQVVIVSTNITSYRDVQLLMVKPRDRFKDVQLLLKVSAVHPGISRSKRSDATRVWYRRLHPSSGGISGPSGSPGVERQRGDLFAGGSLGYFEQIRGATHIDWEQGYDDGHLDNPTAVDNIMRLTGRTFSPSGDAFSSHDDPTQQSDYAPHDLVYLSRNPNTGQPGLAVLVARLDDTLELWTFDLSGTLVHKYNGTTGDPLETDPTWKRNTLGDEGEVLPYARLDVLCDSKTIYYTDMGRTIFQYDLTGTGTQLSNFAQLDTAARHIYASIRIVKPSGKVLVAMTSSGNGPRNALALNSDRATFWADEINPPDGFYDIGKRNLQDGAQVMDASFPPAATTYRVRLEPGTGDTNSEVWSLATWFSPCLVPRVGFTTVIG